MSRCPKLEYEDTGWFSWRDYCKVTGEEVGNEHRKEKVENLCNNENCDAYKDCPVYKASR